MNLAIIAAQLPPLHGGGGTLAMAFIEALHGASNYNITLYIPNPPKEFEEKVRSYFQENKASKSGKASLVFLPAKPLSSFKKKMLGIPLETMGGLLESRSKNDLEGYFEKTRFDLIIVIDPPALAGVPGLFGYGTAIAWSHAQKNNIPLLGYYCSHYIGASKYYPFLRSLAGFKWPLVQITRNIMKKCDHILLFSEYMQLQLDQIGVHHSSILPADTLHTHEIEKHLPRKIVKETVTTIIFFGRLMKEKNTKMMCDVFLNLQKTNPNFKVWIIGSGPEKKSMEKKLLSKVDAAFYDWMSKKELYAKIASAHVIINCTDFETLNLSLAESMYLKLAPVAYYRGGHTKLIDHHISGYLCKDVDDYTRKLNYLITHPEAVEKIGAEAKKKVTAVLDPATNGKAMVKFIESYLQYKHEA